MVSTPAAVYTKESSCRSMRSRLLPCTPAGETQAPPLLPRGVGGAGSGAWPQVERAPPRPRPWSGAGGGGRQKEGRVPTRRLQGDDDVPPAAGFGTFGQLQPLPGNAGQARSQGPAQGARRWTPVRAVLASPCSEPPSGIPGGCGFLSSPKWQPHPGPTCRAGCLLPSRHSLLLPLCPELSTSPHLQCHHAASGHHSLPASLGHCHSCIPCFPLS